MKNNKYLTLFVSTFFISMFTFGGGYVIISLLKKKFVDELKWIEEEEMLNLAAIAQSSPGAVAVNASILVGYKIGGVFGSIVSIVGTILPPFIIISIISFFYTTFRESKIVSVVLKGMQSGVIAVITDVTFNLGQNSISNSGIISIFLIGLVFVLVYFLSINVIFIILIYIILGIVKTFYNQKKGSKQCI
ncbi:MULTISPECIES: chromate transporter [Fusobacterium]|uniref:chromate transporter n=1 Tax=Fusobacterium TaxID=848 RepID=UPI001476B9C8|nr:MULTISPECIES: chromate transporter [Fusobacterium]NME36658.1 chromate transporter [Fusobacterium sp. FSA-380-WT-3A]